MPTQNTDIFQTVNPGISFTANSQTWTIAPTVIVSSTANHSVYSTFNGSKLINHGHIMTSAAGAYAAILTGSNGVIMNAADGSMFGASHGLVVNGVNATINNLGSVIGRDQYGAVFGAASDNVVLNNSGFLFGGHSAVAAVSPGDGSEINNSGVIRGGTAGLYVVTGAGLKTVVDNDGTIKGPSSITTIAGGVSVTNDGRLVGMVDLNALAQADVIVNRGNILGQVFLGQGNDLFKGLGNGTSGKVFGEDGNDKLLGGNKADQLNGGLGKDIQSGRLGADRFDFDSLVDSVVGALRDKITDFSHAQHDRIDIDGIDANTLMPFDQDFTFRGTQAFTSVAQLRYVKMNAAGTANDKTIVSGNVDFNFAPDFQIELKGLHNLVAADFFL